MTLLSACQRVAQETGFDVPSTIVGNADPTAVQLLALAKTAGEELAEDFEWQELSALHTITTVASDEDYALPSDWGWPIRATWWDRTQRWPMFGPVSPQQWQEIKSGLFPSSALRRAYRIFGNQILIDPTPTASGDTLVFEYQKNTWCQSSGGTPQTTWSADTDVSVIPERVIRLDLKWRFLDAKGLAYAEAMRNFEQARDRFKARNKDRSVIKLDGPPQIGLHRVNVPETGFGS